MKLKKLLAGLVSAAMVMSTMIMPAFADDGTVREVSTAAELKTAFADAQTGDTVKLMEDITVNEQIDIKNPAALKGITLDGNGKTINAQLHTSSGGGSPLYFGNADENLYCTGISIRNLTINGEARFGIFLCGGTSSTLENVNISGNFLYAVNFYGTHGATLKNCNISNSNDEGVNNEFGAAVWSNVASANPLILVNTKISSIAINKYTTANTLAPKIYVDKDSSTEIRTYDDGSVSKTRLMCLDADSEGEVSVKQVTDAGLSAAIPPAVKIGHIYYEDIVNAAAAAKEGDRVSLVKNNETENIVKFASNVTLDLCGYTLKSVYAGGYAFVFLNGGTIVDSGEEKGAIISTAARTISSGGSKLTVDGATLTLDTPTKGIYAVVGTTAGLDIKNSTVIANCPDGYALCSFASTNEPEVYNVENTKVYSTVYGVYRNGSAGSFKMDMKDSEIAVGDYGEFKADPECAGLYISNNKKSADELGKHQITIENSKISGNTGIEGKYSDFKLSNCEVTAKTAPKYVQNNNGSTTTGFAIVITDNTVNGNEVSPRGRITIDSGSYNGLIGLENFEDAKKYIDGKTTDVVLTGGDYSFDTVGYTADGYATKLVDGRYYVVKAEAKISNTDKAPGVTVTLDKNTLKKQNSVDLNKAAKYQVVVSTAPAEDAARASEKIAVDFADATDKQIFDISVIKTDSNGKTTDISKEIKKQDVTIALANAPKENSDVRVFHVLDDGTVEEITPVTVEGNTVKFVAPSFSTYAVAYSADSLTEAEISENVGVVFSKVEGTDNEYNIVLKALDGKKINRFMVARLAFKNACGTVDYEITPAANMTASLESTNVQSREYRFNMDGTNANGATGDAITIGKIVFEGYGALDFSIDTSYAAAGAINVVETANDADNIVTSYSAADGTLTVNMDSAPEKGTITDTIELEKKTLTVNIDFNNRVEKNAAAYQNMKVTISGGDLAQDEVIALGEDNFTDDSTKTSYSVSKELTVNTAYTVTVSGAGYRTARYTVTMTNDKVLNFWNNAKDADAVVEEGNANSARKVTFLAGDIVKDNSINVYDLSAVVSYFGMKIDKDTQPEYARYDLNRDGAIDSRDVAYVLVSWGK